MSKLTWVLLLCSSLDLQVARSTFTRARSLNAVTFRPPFALQMLRDRQFSFSNFAVLCQVVASCNLWRTFYSVQGQHNKLFNPNSLRIDSLKKALNRFSSPFGFVSFCKSIFLFASLRKKLLLCVFYCAVKWREAEKFDLFSSPTRSPQSKPIKS